MNKPAAITVLAWDRLMNAGTAALRAARAELKRAGMPPLEWYDLLLEIERRGPSRPRDLQRWLDMAQYTLSRTLDRMEKRGLVRISACPGDGRGQVVELTELGVAERARMWPAYANAIHGVIEQRLDDGERVALAGLLARVA
ncbi:MarR family winged helix-turn-helix transcriptional regulator [Novosphingobium cyanobacteriorum]|uniref:MarR family winged helix-turn-helix transcriptional regulator n=1 Tax=Novosphingobium cyanobacteriorum TaxID=3024215 RepID=A0ABT6CM98_9SPHN|nr:MarR family winged helix-turn-helix transcriptional regulator [Novosphingobium cyanobacteriorum]MDF8335046.1 MarR family winged helix-turn-helix transcriptional regulator [Novosphingobium cyanobacteriorum]